MAKSREPPSSKHKKIICPYLVVVAALLEAGVKRGKDWKTLNLRPEKPEVTESEREKEPPHIPSQVGPLQMRVKSAWHTLNRPASSPLPQPEGAADVN